MQSRNPSIRLLSFRDGPSSEVMRARQEGGAGVVVACVRVTSCRTQFLGSSFPRLVSIESCCFHVFIAAR